MTMLTTAAERLAELLAAAKAGKSVTPEELAQASAEADAEADINRLRETGKAERERDRAERQRQADKAAAAAAARDELPAAREDLRAAYQALAVILEDVTAAHQRYADTVRHHVQALTDAGHVGITSFRREWDISDLPDYDPAIVPDTNSYPAVTLDGVRHLSHLNVGVGIMWAACQAGHGPAIDQWRRSGNTGPIHPPLPELGEDPQ